MYIITSDFNNFSTSVFKVNSKEVKLATKNNLATAEQCDSR